MRALGIVAALAWIGLALLHHDEWMGPGLVALGASLAAAVALKPVASILPKVLLAPPRTVFVGGCALVAGGLSWWVVHRTLGDRPLSIDAGVYLLQARALAHGHFGMPEPLPAQAFADRFVLEGPDERLYGIFPPGWPLALVPFVWIGQPMLAGPALAVALVGAQALLGRALGRASGDERDGELATRVSLLLSLPSVGRALETADLLSHALVAVLACTALALAVGEIERRPRAAGLALGACVGWVLAARLLDGVVLAAAVGGVIVGRREAWRAVGWVVLGSAPFLLLLAFEQHAATGAWLMPTQTAYFQRSDWPSTCHRLGFGPDVGCTVEHPTLVARMGGEGFGPRAALAVVREQAGSLGEELVGYAPLLLVAFAPVVLGPAGSRGLPSRRWAAARGADAIAVAFFLGLTLTYGLFYYGTAMFFGARHLFPVAPFAWLLVARGATQLPHRVRGWLDAPHVRGAAVVTVLVVCAVASRAPWRTRTAGAREFQTGRSDLRRSLAAHGVDRGILKSRDFTALTSAFDPWADGADRLFALEDNSGLLELRRAHPELPVFLSLPDDAIGHLYVSRPPPGMLLELEREWPSFVRPDGLATRESPQEGASGGQVLLVSHATPGASAVLPFDVALPADYVLRLDGFGGPEAGDYDLFLDGDPLGRWQGYAPDSTRVRSDAARRTLASGRHVLEVRCTGHDPASHGYDAKLDALVGEVR
jgi:hypothetical protein